MKRDWLAVGTAACALWAPTALAQASDEPSAQTIVVIAPGGAIDIDDALRVTAEDIDRAGTPDLLAALARKVAGITLQDAQNNPWQPNLVYRGFVASPLQGQAQGIAAYLDGARFNQPFGDTVQFDLIPETAIRRISLLDASPVYGLNALGGALALETKTGRSNPGLVLTGTGGRFGYAEGSAAAGFSKDALSGFITLQESHEAGWRDFSPSTLYNGYADFGFDGADGGLHVKLIGADTNLTGNGVSPVELLAADRDAVFTFPDNTRNRYGRVSLHPWIALTPQTRLEASLYSHQLQSRTVNGDAADIEECEEEENEGLLCLEGVSDDEGDDEESRLTDADGNPIDDSLGGEGYGVLNLGHTRTKSSGVLFQLIDTRPLGSGENHLAVGFSHDRSRTRFGTSTELGRLTEERSVAGFGVQIVQADGAIAPVELIAKTRNWGIFLADRLPIAPGLSAEIGLRWNHARIVLEDQIGTALNGQHVFRRLNPGIELDYEVSDGLSLRAGYAESNRAPTPAELSCADEAAPCNLTNFFIADPPLEQVVARTWEAGALGKSDLGAFRFEWLLSAYRTTNSNDIQYIASNIRGRAYFQNVGKSRRQGIEASLTAKTGGFAASASYAFIDATYRTPLVLSSPANPESDDAGTILVARGNKLPGIPRHSATLALDYDGGRWSIGGDAIARSGQFLIGDESNANAKVPGYVVVNFRGGVELMPGLTLFGELRNAFDHKYATFGTFSEVDEIELDEAPGASNPRAYGPGAPRRWLAGLKAKF
ncbi:TonB-dependent receptor [Sphingopyxis sp.]|jgi:outer membrane receptor protein involved in Fe transport|uniref:TonB-dependent receptor n=1 Tax=Sphingomonadales TaxID=204457 RepID=UPI003F6E6499